MNKFSKLASVLSATVFSAGLLVAGGVAANAAESDASADASVVTFELGSDFAGSTVVASEHVFTGDNNTFDQDAIDGTTATYTVAQDGTLTIPLSTSYGSKGHTALRVVGSGDENSLDVGNGFIVYVTRYNSWTYPGESNYWISTNSDDSAEIDTIIAKDGWVNEEAIESTGAIAFTGLNWDNDKLSLNITSRSLYNVVTFELGSDFAGSTVVASEHVFTGDNNTFDQDAIDGTTATYTVAQDGTLTIPLSTSYGSKGHTALRVVGSGDENSLDVGNGFIVYVTRYNSWTYPGESNYWISTNSDDSAEIDTIIAKDGWVNEEAIESTGAIAFTGLNWDNDKLSLNITVE